ncbi:MAG: selenium-binding protein SBP56-related protein [Desulfobacterales bacterium]
MNTIKQTRYVAAAILIAGFFILASHSALANETGLPHDMAKITGQEDFIHIWTLGAEGIGDEQDKLVTVAVNPNSKQYGKVVHSVSVGGRNEAHHMGFTFDRKYLWAATLDTSKIFIFDIHTNPAQPKLIRTITDFVAKSGGVVGPHTVMPVKDRMLITGLSNNRDHGGRSALVEYTDEGKYVATYWLPTDDNLQGAEKTGKYADGYNYDVRALSRLDAMFTSSFTGWSNYMMDFGKMLKDEEAMKRFGNTLVVWRLSERKPLKIFDIPGAPLEIRIAINPENDYGFVTTALTSKIWLVYHDPRGEWQAKEVGNIGDPSKVPLPVAFTISSDDKLLWVDTFMDGTVRAYDISDPFHPVQVYEKQIGSQVNMVSTSWDGKRLYFTSSLLSKWDKKGKDNEQFIKGFEWDGKELKERFSIDFFKEKLGRPHEMKFSAYSLYKL